MRNRGWTLSLLILGLALWAAAPAVAANNDAANEAAARSQVDLALHHLTQGDYAGAEPLLRAALQRNPGDGLAALNLGAALRGLGRNQEAIDAYQVALERLPAGDHKGRDDAWYGIALASDGLGDAQRAAHAWNDYIAHAQPFADERGGLTVAATRRAEAEQLAGTGARPPGTQKAGR